MNLGETCHLKRRDLVTVRRTMLLLCCYHCDCMQQHYDVTQFEYVLWGHTIHEWVMNIHYKTWIAQGPFTNIILTPSKQWSVCTVYDWMAVTFYRLQWSFWVWPQPNWEMVLSNVVFHWLRPCSQSDWEDHSGYGPSHWETVLQTKLSLIGWFHTQNDPSMLSINRGRWVHFWRASKNNTLLWSLCHMSSIVE